MPGRISHGHHWPGGTWDLAPVCRCRELCPHVDTQADLGPSPAAASLRPPPPGKHQAALFAMSIFVGGGQPTGEVAGVGRSQRADHVKDISWCLLTGTKGVPGPVGRVRDRSLGGGQRVAADVVLEVDVHWAAQGTSRGNGVMVIMVGSFSRYRATCFPHVSLSNPTRRHLWCGH